MANALRGSAGASRSQEHETPVRGAIVDRLEDGGLDNHVTNEPILAEEGVGAQQSSDLVVTADSGGALGLDNDGKRSHSRTCGGNARGPGFGGPERVDGRAFGGESPRAAPAAAAALGCQVTDTHCGLATVMVDPANTSPDPPIARVGARVAAGAGAEGRRAQIEGPGSLAEAGGMSGDLWEVVARGP